MTHSPSPRRSLLAYRIRAVPLLAAVAFAVFAGGHAAAKDRIEVVVDEAKVMTIPSNVKTMVLGNPGIADVTILKKGGKMVLTGKAFGETNLVALDNENNLLFESVIRVSAPGGKLVVQRGMDRNSYICNPRCEPTFSLGDASDFAKAADSQAGLHSTSAKPGDAAGGSK